ncbi:LppU/SCO3897 family protein [Micromonospora citrea]|uniref:LppU/SCO3897 family protein n=1 Tax=Micromonospora citrea TaxID=47855 RepID=UPI003C4EEE00
MTSEGQHRPGQEPDEVPPGAGGPAPYGDRQTQQGYGSPATPDLGWAPPPPTGRPEQPPAWATPADQPPAWGAPQPPQGEPAQPGGWTPAAAAPQPAWASQPDQQPTGTPQPAWAGPADQPPAAWATAPGQSEPAQPAWAPAEQAAPAWAQPESGARGAARVPQPAGQPHDAWPAQADPHGAGGWNPTPAPQEQDANGWPAGRQQQNDANHAGGWDAPSHQDDPARSGGWNAPSTQDDPARSGGSRTGGQEQDGSADANGWNNGVIGQEQAGQAGGWSSAPRTEPAWNQDPAPQEQPGTGWQAPQQQDDPARSGGWNAPSTSDDAPRSTGRASVPAPPQPEPTGPAWAQPEPGARGAAQVPQADAPDANGWSTEGDPARSGGWPAPAPQEQAGNGWNAAPQQDERAPQPWATGADEPATARWDARETSQPADAWSGAAPGQDDQRPDDRSTQDEPARGGPWRAAAAPQQEDRPEPGGWTPPEQPARATASVPKPDGPPAWVADRPVVPDAEPWAPGEAWGRNEAESAQQPGGDAWEPQRADDAPIYQPAPAPGISPANMVPLPPQEQRVPGASLAAVPPADYAPPTPFGGAAEQPAFEPNGREGAPSGWGPADEPQSPAGPVVPGPRTSPEADGAGRASVPAAEGAEGGAVGRASASASVPLASRVMPPTDQAVRPGGTAAPQPRVYGRPARPEQSDEPVEEHGAHQPGHDPHPRFDDPPRFDDQDRTRFDEPERPGGPHGFGGDAPSSAPPTSPAAPQAYPGGIPAFADPTSHNRPMNGTRPHGSAERPAEPFGAPPVDGPPSGGVPGYGHPAHDPTHGGLPSPFPPAGQPFPPAGQQPFPSAGQPGPAAWPQDPEPEQGRFDSFKPEAEPKAEQPTPKVRNGRVLAMVLIAAVLILAVPLGLLSLLGKIGGDDAPAPFNPAVGSCVKQSGGGAVAAGCGEPEAFTVVKKVDAKDKCGDPSQPHVVLPGSGADRVLCLKKAAQ